MKEVPQTTATPADRRALERCAECFDDGQDTDIGCPAIDRLVALGWLDQIDEDRRPQVLTDFIAAFDEVETD